MVLQPLKEEAVWMKGEASGNVQHVRDVLVDCDSDALIYLVEPTGPACHKGDASCFHKGILSCPDITRRAGWSFVGWLNTTLYILVNFFKIELSNTIFDIRIF